MWRTLTILSLALGLAAASAIDQPREKKTGYGPGIATLVGTLAILKIKAVFVTLLVLAAVAVFSKLLGAGCTGGGLDVGCGAAGLLTPTAHSSGSAYNYDGYGSVNSGAGYNYYNHRSLQTPDLVELGMDALGLTDDCRNKLVCLADNEALKFPLLMLFTKAFEGSLSKYRDSGEAERWRDCDQLYPSCGGDGAGEEDPSAPKPTNKLPPHAKVKRPVRPRPPTSR